MTILVAMPALGPRALRILGTGAVRPDEAVTSAAMDERLGLPPGTVEERVAAGLARATALALLTLADYETPIWLPASLREGPAGAWEIEPQIDRTDHARKANPEFRVSAVTGEGVTELKLALVARARDAMPKPGETALNARQRALLGDAADALNGVEGQQDPLLIAEQLRVARLAFDRLTGRAATEDMLDALFGRFCIGK